MSKHRLLLADDSVTIQKVVNLTFADEGIEVISVGDGNSAMEKFVEATPDLVMVDVNMPGVDGYRICEMIKQDEETRHVPVILLVGSFEPFDEDEARRVGANDYLTKPFQSIRQLVNKVTVLLNKSNGSELSGAPVVVNDSVQETPVQQNIEQFQSIETPVQAQTEETSEPLGDAGMDDEMIQTSQIGSLPVDDVQKLETNRDEFEPTAETGFEREADFAQTQPYTAEEFSKLTSTSSEDYQPPNSSQNYSAQRISAEERAISLENQMVSEFEPEFDETVSDFETKAQIIENSFNESSQSQPVWQEDVFIPEEIPQEKGFEIEQIDQITDDSANYYDTSQNDSVLEELYNAPEDTETAESIGSEFYSTPETADLPEISDSDYLNESFEDLNHASDTADSKSTREFQTETPVEAEQTSTPAYDFFATEIIEEKYADFNSEETVSEQPIYFEDQETSEQQQVNLENEPTVENEQQIPAELSFVDNHESEFKSETETDYPKSVTFSEPESYFSRENQAQAEQFADEEPTTPRVEILAPFPTTEEEISQAEETAETEESASAEQTPAEESSYLEETASIEKQSPAEEIISEDINSVQEQAKTPEFSPVAEDEKPLQVEQKDQSAQTPFNSLVSNKEKSEAVESVIVSEFARHSISLSSEAVETIASRIADKISEKIIQQLANDVVENLADLIVERMERKKLE